MTAKIDLTQEVLKSAVERYCKETPAATYSLVGDGDKKDQYRIMINGNPDDQDIYVWLEDGKLKCSDPLGWGEDFNKSYILAVKTVVAPRPPRKENIPSKGQTSSLAPAVRPDMPIRDIQVAELTFEDIRQYLCPSASDKDVFMFLKLCQARNLNPFCNEAYLIPYKDQKTQEIKCSMVVGKEAFMRKAEANPHYRGFKAGLILTNGEELIYREGTFQRRGETLEGAYCEVYRDDRDAPVRTEVSLVEYDQGHGLWNHGKKATMIRKVAVVGGHREAFPSDTSGLYGSEELGIDPSNEIGA
jgi:phage recombination protein Bet